MEPAWILDALHGESVFMISWKVEVRKLMVKLIATPQTRFSPQKEANEGKSPFFPGKSRLVNYYNLVRYIYIYIFAWTLLMTFILLRKGSSLRVRNSSLSFQSMFLHVGRVPGVDVFVRNTHEGYMYCMGYYLHLHSRTMDTSLVWCTVHVKKPVPWML